MKFLILNRSVVLGEGAAASGAPADCRPAPGSLEAIARLCQAGYRIFIVSESATADPGPQAHEEQFAMNDRLQKRAGELGGRIEGFVFASAPAAGAPSKASPGVALLGDLARRLGVSLEETVVVGSSKLQLEIAHAAGGRPVLVRCDSNVRTEMDQLPKGASIYPDLPAFAAALLMPPTAED